MTAVLLAAGAQAQQTAVFELNAADFAPGKDRVLLDRGWRFHAGDLANGADPELDDRAWPVLPSWPGSPENPEGAARRGHGWHRLHLRVDPALQGRTLGVSLNHVGASAIYLNGVLWRRFGEPGANPDNERSVRALQPYTLQLDRRPDQVLAIYFSNYKAVDLFPNIRFHGVRPELWEPQTLFDRYFQAREQRERSGRQAMALAGVYSAIALLHFFLYGFDRKNKSNLYFAAMTGFSAILVYSQREILAQTDLEGYHLALKIWGSMQIAAGIFLPMFTRSLFFAKVSPRVVWAFAGICVATILWGWRFNFGDLWVRLALTLILVDTLITLGQALRQKKEGATLVGVGLIILSVVIIGEMFAWFPSALYAWIGFNLGMPHLGAVGLSMCMSIFLSHKFAATNRDLAEQLAAVKKLSAEVLEKERQAKDQEIKRRLLEADNRRKTNELEEARAFQLSMLPKSLPALPDLQLAASMDTAAEVGGDYYDFHMDPAGRLTLALGDAAGHGAKAGVLVAAVKSLFAALAKESHIPNIFKEMNGSLKQMNLRNMFMALTLIKIRGRELTLSAAGMPPILIYRAASGEVEDLLVKGLPLGGVSGYPYREETLSLTAGDAALLMSDGLPELFNQDEEMFGLDRCKEAFRRVGGRAPAEVIAALKQAALDWRGERDQDDDLTLMALRAV